MIAYVDSSVLLRKLLGEANPLEELFKASYFVSSELLRTECLRTMHRLRIAGVLNDEEMAGRCRILHEAFQYFEFVEVNREVLDRASEAFPTSLGTLDALHLASAILWKRTQQSELTMLTHDRSLGRAARSLGFAVFGV
ncbi:MAG: type II toxin-antitoxin system VapC family toxin [Acidobacteria bacterium]|nr:type II toxin-antitoxin system VapC family toxin [Acidobacteriota bacterium]